MPCASERKTALYDGGNHRVPHRMNDVRDYRLGSTIWHLLCAPDAGNAEKHKSAYFLTSRSLVQTSDSELDEKQRAEIAYDQTWWEENVVFDDGHLAT